MDWSFLRFLTNPNFVWPWYGVGVALAAATAYDVWGPNRHVMTPLKPAWLIIIIFFSIIGAVWYWFSCRPHRIGKYPEPEADQRHSDFVSDKWKRVSGSVIHCVAGDGLGIFSAMVGMRLLGVSFWTEFWVEYAVGYLFGWFLFQATSMKMMGNSWPMAIWKGGRAEFFSMITVMLGMGIIMGLVRPLLLPEPPLPDTAAFWGLGALGLLLGAMLTFPMNWWLVSINWKHGMG